MRVASSICAIGRHQRGAVLQRPAVVLDVGDLDAVGVERDGHVDHVGQLVEVLPVHHGVDGERQAEFAGPAGGFELLRVALEAGDAVGEFGFVALEADLDVVEAGIGQRRELFARQQHRRGDEVGVEAEVGGVLDQLDEVLADGRLAAGEMDLEHADLGELGHHLLPLVGGELVAGALHLDRVGAIAALQRAAVGEFEQHGERDAVGLGDRLARCDSRMARPSIGSAKTGLVSRRVGLMASAFRASTTKPDPARSCSMAMTSAPISSRGAA